MMRAKKKKAPTFKNVDEDEVQRDILPLEDSADDDSEGETNMAQYSDLLKQYRLQQFKEGIASDLEDDDDEDDNDEDGGQLQRKNFASEKWGTRRDTFYGAEGEDELVLGAPGAREEQVEAEEEAAEMEEEEVDRLRALLYGGKPSAGRATSTGAGGLLGATLEHEVVADRAGGDVGADAGAAGSSDSADSDTDDADSATESAAQVGGAAPLLVGGLRPYRAPSQGTPLDAHLAKDYPEVAHMRAKLHEMQARRSAWWGRDEAQLAPAVRLDKWYTVMLAAFLGMCESGADVRRHAILPTLRRLDALRNTTPPPKSSLAPVDAEAADLMQVYDSGSDNDDEEAAPMAMALDDEAAAAAAEDELQGARPASYAILKNREVGAPKGSKKARKRDRNPRVKHRHKFKKALVRRKSQVPALRAQSRPYGGETTGIRSGMVRARKFKG